MSHVLDELREKFRFLRDCLPDEAVASRRQLELDAEMVDAFIEAHPNLVDIDDVKVSIRYTVADKDVTVRVMPPGGGEGRLVFSTQE